MRIVKVFAVCGILAGVCGCIADGPRDRDEEEIRKHPSCLYWGTFAW